MIINTFIIVDSGWFIANIELAGSFSRLSVDEHQVGAFKILKMI